MSDDVLHLDAGAQAELVRSGEVDPVELVDASIAAIEKLDGELNAVIHTRFERAREEARAIEPGDDRPFAGVPYVHKDHDGSIAGEPLHHGCRGLKEAGYVHDVDSNMARRLHEAGFVCVGKTNLPEFGLVPTTEPEAYGPTHNPWDTSRSPGGSSGGSAAAVASRAVPMGSAGDGGGSIRWPASACGLVGLKTTRGRISLAPEGESWGGLVVQGFLTRSVRDTAAVLEVTAGREPGDPYAAPPADRPFTAEVGEADAASRIGRLRVGVLTEAPGGAAVMHPDCVAAVEETARLLESLGHEVEESHPAALTEEDMAQHFTNVYTVFAANELDVWGPAIGKESLSEDDVEAGTWALAEAGRAVSAPAYYQAWEHLRAVSRRIQRWWEVDGWDVLLCPTGAEPPPTLGQFGSPPDNPLQGLFRSAAVVPFLVPWNVTGQPAISLPASWNDDGVPVGVQLVGGYAREALLLRVGAQVEAARPWEDRRPPVSV